MTTGGKVLVGFICVVTIWTTYPMIAERLRDSGPGPPRVESPRPPPKPALQPDPQSERQQTYAPSNGPGAHDMGPAPKLYRWQERILETSDYSAFVREALPAANDGNGDAQFALYAAFSYCRDGLKPRTAAQLARLPEEILREMHERCDTLATQYPDLPGEAARWLNSALDQKFPRALAYAGLEKLALAQQTKNQSARDSLIAEARALTLQALRSNDPAITFEVGQSLPGFFPDDPRVERANLVWRLAGCEQGLDCGADAHWLQVACLMRNNCQPGETGAQYLQRISGDFSSLKARARELARKLRKSQFDEKAFIETVTSLPMPERSNRNQGGAAATLVR